MDERGKRWDDPGPLCDMRVLDQISRLVEEELGRPIDKIDGQQILWPAFFADILVSMRSLKEKKK